MFFLILFQEEQFNNMTCIFHANITAYIDIAYILALYNVIHIYICIYGYVRYGTVYTVIRYIIYILYVCGQKR